MMKMRILPIIIALSMAASVAVYGQTGENINGNETNTEITLTRHKLTETEICKNKVYSVIDSYFVLRGAATMDDPVTMACMKAAEELRTSAFDMDITTSDGQSLVGPDFAALSVISNYYYEAANHLLNTPYPDPHFSEVIRSSTKSDIQARTGNHLASKDSSNVVMVEAARIAVFLSRYAYCNAGIKWGDLINSTDYSVDNCNIAKVLNFSCNGVDFIAEFDTDGNLCNVIAADPQWDTDERSTFNKSDYGG